MAHIVTTDIGTIQTVFHKCFHDRYGYGIFAPETDSLLNICQSIIAQHADLNAVTETVFQIELTDWELEEWNRKTAKPVWK